jgi:antitoxin (DNA-binding transcriptional repressor) of toxin-antitoxin stability system
LNLANSGGKIGDTYWPGLMRTISVRDLRQRWPEVEARLRVEKEIVIIRNAKPVAKLVHVDDGAKARRRFDPVAHAKWQREIAAGKITRWVGRAMKEERSDRR